MKVRDLNQSITILAPMVEENALNENVTSWANPRTVFAKVVEGSGREFVNGDQVISQKKAAFKIRFAQDVTTDHRVQWINTVYEIVDVTGTYRSGEMWLHCQSLPGVKP
ncbi:hypothetical protein BH11PSE5_BH11PSE5_20760 [soil metagenome]